MPTHALYIDDSGQKEYAHSGLEYGTSLSRYFVFGGYFTTLREAGRPSEEVRELKSQTFGTTKVEIKSNWLRIPHEREMMGKTPRHSDYRANLERHHEQLKKSGSSLLGIPITVLDGRIKFVNSKDSELVQIADIVAYNVLRQFRDHGEEWEQRGLTQLPTYDWFRKIAAKFRRGPDGRIQGYGVVKFPLKERVGWRIRT